MYSHSLAQQSDIATVSEGALGLWLRFLPSMHVSPQQEMWGHGNEEAETEHLFDLSCEK